MRNTIYVLLVFLLNFSCSKTDSNETEKTLPLSLPKTTTTSVTEITENSAFSGGNVSENGGAPISARGLSWSTSTEPTLSDNNTTNGTGLGEFSSSLEDLEANTTYYLRSYATNSEGTTYGNEISFKTLEIEPVAKVFEGDVLLTSQKEVDDFGEEKYSEVTGNLAIIDSNFPPIKNLDSLDELLTVGGNLRIEETTSIEFANLNGLSSLASIKGGLMLIGNYWLNDLSGLENLSELNSLEINRTANLFFLTGLEKITTLESLLIIDNQQLKNLDGLRNLSSVENKIVIDSNQGLLNMSGLENLKELKSLDISHNEGLIDLTGLENLEKLDDLIVSYNSSLNDFCGLTLLIVNNGLIGNFNVKNNFYNPTQQDILDGNCAK